MCKACIRTYAVSNSKSKITDDVAFKNSKICHIYATKHFQRNFIHQNAQYLVLSLLVPSFYRRRFVSSMQIMTGHVHITTQTKQLLYFNSFWGIVTKATKVTVYLHWMPSNQFADNHELFIDNIRSSFAKTKRFLIIQGIGSYWKITQFFYSQDCILFLCTCQHYLSWSYFQIHKWNLIYSKDTTLCTCNRLINIPAYKTTSAFSLNPFYFCHYITTMLEHIYHYHKTCSLGKQTELGLSSSNGFFQGGSCKIYLCWLCKDIRSTLEPKSQLNLHESTCVKTHNNVVVADQPCPWYTRLLFITLLCM